MWELCPSQFLLGEKIELRFTVHKTEFNYNFKKNWSGGGDEF